MISPVHTQGYYARVLSAAAIGIALSAVAFIMLLNSERHDIEMEFLRTASDRALALEHSINDNVESLEDIQSLYKASEDVERHEFRAFIEHELEERPGIQALEWIPRVAASERAAFEEAARNDGFLEFRIVERESQGTMVPAEFRDEYFPVYYVEPYQGNEAALGFDLASNPIRLEALNKSRDTGQGVATARITLVQETEDQFGFLVFEPIYLKGFPAETLAQRRENLTGFALGVFRISDMLEHSLARSDTQTSGPGLDIQLYDRSAPPEQQLLFTTVPGNGAAAQVQSRLSLSRTFDVAGRNWELILTSPAAGLSVWSIWQAWAALAGGLLFTGLLSAYFLAAARRATAVELLVATRTLELSQSNARLETANQELQELDRLKDSFLSMVSHELRTPLTSIKGSAEILLSYDDIDRDTQIEFMTIINNESDRLTRLINDFLDLSRIESGQQEWETAVVSISKVIESATNAIQTLVVQKDLNLVVDLEHDLPSTWSDQDRLIQVVTNLLSNAIKFTPEHGQIGVKAQFIKSAEAGEDSGVIQVSVSDSGIGIAPEDHEAVFEKFKQVGDTLSDRPRGTGLGLPICKEIVEHFGGTISLESELGKGSTFFFTMPVLQQVEAELPATGEGREYVPVAGAKTILVVDDEENIRRLLSHELIRKGYIVIEASDGLQAIDLARQRQPDLITLDIIMPNVNGYDVVAVLRNDPETSEIPILIVSIIEDTAKGIRVGASDYVTKPFQVEEVLQKISGLLQKGAAKVLVADDDRSLVAAIKFELEKRGYTPSVAYSGEEALKSIEEDRPDLIVLDIVMPGMDGYEVMKALKENPGTADIPVVVLTDVEIDGDHVRALSLGASGFVIKSGGLEKLFEAIENVLSVESSG